MLSFALQALAIFAAHIRPCANPSSGRYPDDHTRPAPTALLHVSDPPCQVASLEQRLHHWLSPGGAVPYALDASATTLEDLPYTLGSHCAGCKAAPRCWADTMTRGSLQLAGCRPAQVAALRAAGVSDLGQLAASEDHGPQQVPGIAPHELSVLRLVARARQKAMAAGPATQGHRSAPAERLPPAQQRQWQQQTGAAAASATAVVTAASTPVALLPGARRTCLPPHAYMSTTQGSASVYHGGWQPLTRVYMSVAWDPVLGRVVALAAHVADAPQRPWDTGDSGGTWAGRWAAMPPRQDEQEGVDIVHVMPAPELRSTDPHWSPLRVPDHVWDASEVGMLVDFTKKLTLALRVSMGGRNGNDCTGLHVYVHARSEVQQLLSRCSYLAERLEAGLRGGRGGVAARAEPDWQLQQLRFLSRLLTMHPCIREASQPGSTLPWDGQGMVSAVEEEVARYATPWVGNGLQAATAVEWAGEGMDWLYDWGLEPPATRTGSSSSSRRDQSWRHEVDRLVSGLYMRSVWPMGQYGQEQRGHGNQQQGQAHGGQRASRLVQLRPDLPSSNLPLSLFWEAWRRGEYGLPEQVLLQRARAVRWVEERLVRLAHPTGHGPGIAIVPKVGYDGHVDPYHLVKRPLNLLDMLVEGGWHWQGDQPSVMQDQLAWSAVHVCAIGRAAELSQFWEQLLRTPPAVRASEGRGTLVLGDVRMEGSPAVLVGRVLWPQGCSSSQDLKDLTGLGPGESVVVTLAGPDPQQCQGPDLATPQRCVLAKLQHCGPAYPGGGLIVQLQDDSMDYKPGGMPVRSAPGLTLSGLASAAGSCALALDEAPNISSWVTAAVLNQLSGSQGRYGSSMLARLTIPLEVAWAFGKAVEGLQEQEVEADAQQGAAALVHNGSRVMAGSMFVEQPPPPPGMAFPYGPQLGMSAYGPAPGAAAWGPAQGTPRPALRPLDVDQLAAVQAVADSPAGGIMLLQGPPGTGKTETAVRAVLQWLAGAAPPAEGGLVLVSGPTHAAINVAMLRFGELLQGAGGWEREVLRQRVQLVRVGADSSKEPDAEAVRRRIGELGIKQLNPRMMLTG